MSKPPELKIFTGPMFGGKTTRMLAALERYNYQHRSTMLFKPAIDKRYSEEKVVTHKGQEHTSVLVSSGQEILEKGTPGEFRNYSHRSPTGCQYPEPYDLNQMLKKSHAFSNHPWLRHVLYEYVHPFCDGNGRSGRIILASDCDFDFARVNDMIGDDYIDNIVAHMQPDKLNKLL